MTRDELLKGIKDLKTVNARNSMGCSENWYNFFYAMRETFTEKEISGMNEREIEYLYRLADNIQDGLY